MKVEILNLRNFEEKKDAIDVAFPILAYECEASPPADKYLDAYEEAILKFVSIGLGATGISKALNCTEGLVEIVLLNLSDKRRFIHREKGSPWTLTEEGKKYLDQGEVDVEQNKSEFGYMFVSAVRHNVFPYFYKGSIEKASSFRGAKLPFKLTSECDEEKTFEAIKVKKARLREAYLEFVRHDEIVVEFDEGNLSIDEAKDLFEDLESFDEELDDAFETEEVESEKDNLKISKGLYIRALDKAPKKFYLRMQVIIDPHVPGGFRVESPLPLNNIDENYFIQQIQWMRKAGKTYVDESNLDEFMIKEIQKIAPKYTINEKNFAVYVLEKTPLLSIHKTKYANIYDDFSRVYDQLTIQSSMLDKENIVNNLYKYVLEKLFNKYISVFTESQLNSIQKNAFSTLRTKGLDDYYDALVVGTRLKGTDIPWRGYKHLNTVINRLTFTKGNSICEKFVNCLVVNYHLGSDAIKRLLGRDDIKDIVVLIDRLNQVRKKVTHDTDDEFTEKDYSYFISNVYDLVNAILESFEEE